MPASLSLGDIEEALQQADPKTRHQTLRAVTDLFLSSSPHLDDSRVGIFDDVFESLVQRIALVPVNQLVMMKTTLNQAAWAQGLAATQALGALPSNPLSENLG